LTRLPVLVHLDHAVRLGTGWRETAGLPLLRPRDGPVPVPDSCSSPRAATEAVVAGRSLSGFRRLVPRERLAPNAIAPHAVTDDAYGDEVITPTAVNGAIALQRRRLRGLLRPCFATSQKPRAAKGRRLAARRTASQMPINNRTLSRLSWEFGIDRAVVGRRTYLTLSERFEDARVSASAGRASSRARPRCRSGGPLLSRQVCAQFGFGVLD
jgi:hypothetical protein